MINRNITLLSLFGGIDGFALGFQRAGYSIETHYYSEIDKYASAVVRHRFKQAIHVGSVTDVQGSELKRPDIITFGSPCQDFSLAGKRAGMEGKRSSLILEAIRLITEARPSVFIWENVKGAFSSNSGADFTAILQAFANIGGYRLEWQLLNTKWLLPQNRERIYLVGHLAEAGSGQVFPIGEVAGLSSAKEGKRERERQLCSTITSNYRKGVHNGGETYIKTNQSNSRESGVNEVIALKKQSDSWGGVKEFGNAIPCQSARQHKDPPLVIIRTNTKRGEEKLKTGDSINLSNPNSKTRRGRIGKGCAQTLDTGNHQATLQEGKIRRLTEIECERLQGFPDNWTQYGDFGDGIVKEISATQRYKMCGNAVTTDVVKLIAERL